MPIIMTMFVAIDIGGTKTLIAVYSESGEIIERTKYPTEADFKIFINKLISEVEKITADHEVHSICIAAPGLVDSITNKVVRFGNLEWKDVDLVTPLHEAFSVPIAIDNDANLGAVGEANLGAGQNADTVLYVTISTGIGTGVTYKGFIDRAMRKSEGGQMHFRHDGHLMLWEHFASGKAFVDRFHAFGKEVTDEKIWKEYAEDISLGMGSLMAVIQPDVIVIGGSMGEHIEKYHDFLVGALQTSRSPMVCMPKIIEAKYPNEAVINGCYVMAKHIYEAQNN